MNGGEGAENLRRGTIGKGFLGREEWLLARDSYGSLRPARYANHLPLPVPGMKAMVEYHACPERIRSLSLARKELSRDNQVLAQSPLRLALLLG